MIVGIDEVGRGAWAGPLAVGAVLLGGASIDGLTDSKKLTKQQRVELDREIRQKACGIGIGWVSAPVIDRIGLTAALRLASQRAITHIRHEYSEIIIDGTFAFLDDPRVTTMAKADLLIPSVSAASIVAKVARDNYMKHVNKVFPGYKFTGHVGYGTTVHRQAIADLGVSPLHRLSWAPLQQFRAQVDPTFGFRSLIDIAEDSPSWRPKTSAARGRADECSTSDPERSRLRWLGGESSKAIGNQAESKVVEYLKQHGHHVIERNWRTKYCEIDIISVRDDTVYFTEVKYRRNDTYGDGLSAITVNKQRQMAFAAELFAVKRSIHDKHLRLAAASVTGTPPEVAAYLELA